ncbi:hypothetical protein N7535_001483 [Penicillium sp. DV-2018c]|nr:hypothetical protein N7461_005272 [Penicillium sp. DV-2018c]KAJ5582863.1 hypothetical protein N7535_001483 [Penicillium sp. DV-2018c]
MSNPNNLNLTSLSQALQAAPRNNDLSPWLYGTRRVMEPADEDAFWLTVELDEDMQHLDDASLLRFVATEIHKSRVVIDSRAQHYIRPRCLSIPCTEIWASYDVTQNQTFYRVKWWFEEVNAGRAQLDRAVLFGPR